MSVLVVGVDASERTDDALALARVLAGALDARVHLVTAYPHEEELGGVPNPELLRWMRDEADRVLADRSAALGGLVAGATAVGSVSPARALHEVAERERAAAIVIGPTHRAMPGRVATGSVADRLLAGAPCPIAAAPAGYGRAAEPPVLRRVGVAFVRNEAGRSAARAGAALAARAGAQLELLAVADPSVVMRDAWARRAELDELVDAQRAILRQGVDDVLAGLPEATGRVLEGTPADVLCVESLRLDLLVCGSRAYGPATSVLVGGVSKHVLHHAACPVMVVPRASHG